MTAKLTRAEQIERFIVVHGDTYNYDLWENPKASGKSTIICQKHGQFTQVYNVHVNGHGCPKCAHHKVGQDNADRVMFSREKKIEIFREVHGNRYSYEKWGDHTASEKGIIICREHGEFKQAYRHHRKGSGCPQCSAVNPKGGPSLGEQIIASFLKRYGVKAIPETPRLTDGKRFDFYLPDYNLIIEFHGKQHYKGWGGKKKNLKKKQANDRYKERWAKKNGYEFLVIPYWDIGSIDIILREKLQL